MLDNILDAIRANPARVTTIIVAVIVAIAAKAGVVVTEQSVTDTVLLILPILIGGEATRRNVVPLHALTTPASLHAAVAAQDEVSKP